LPIIRVIPDDDDRIRDRFFQEQFLVPGNRRIFSMTKIIFGASAKDNPGKMYISVDGGR
jgi:hypothetical protein